VIMEEQEVSLRTNITNLQVQLILQEIGLIYKKVMKNLLQQPLKISNESNLVKMKLKIKNLNRVQHLCRQKINNKSKSN